MSEADIAIMGFFLMLAIYAVTKSSDRKNKRRLEIERKRYKTWEEYVKSSEICETLISEGKINTPEYEEASKNRSEMLRIWNKLNRKDNHGN